MCKTFHNEWEQKNVNKSLGGLSELITQKCTHVFIKKTQNISHLKRYQKH